MREYIKAEFLKQMGTTSQKMVLLIPFLCMILAGGFCALGGPDVMKLAGITAFNHWGLLWLPAAVILLTGLSHKGEMKSTGYRLIYGLALERNKVWMAKVLVLAVQLLISSFVLWGLVCVYEGALAGFSVHTAAKYLFSQLVSWVLVLWQIPLYLWLAGKVNYVILLIANCALSILIAPVYAVREDWFLVPWAWILRLQAPLLSTHPNGIPLEAGNPLLTYSGMPQMVPIALMLLLAAIVSTTLLFSNRKECQS